VTGGQHAIPAVYCFPDQDYRYKPVATQIPYGAGFAPIHFEGSRMLDRCVEVLLLPLDYDCRTFIYLQV
jgi:hypothetical protein